MDIIRQRQDGGLACQRFNLLGQHWQGLKALIRQAGLQKEVQRPQVTLLALGLPALLSQDIAFCLEQLGDHHSPLDIQLFLQREHAQGDLVIQLFEQVCSQAKQLLQGLVDRLLCSWVLSGLLESGNRDQGRNRLADHAHDVIFG